MKSHSKYFVNLRCLYAYLLVCESVSIWSFSGPYFPSFELNMERYSISVRIQSEFGKIWTRKTPNMHTFHAAFTLV